jgi:ABC-type lipoprotein export system ATPase subunit
MNASDPLVRCDGVSRTFGTGPNAVRAVRDATLQVFPTEHIALVGSSGSGKSTLLHLIAGLDQPTAGTLVWPDLQGAPLRPGPVAVVFQAPSLLPPLDVLENVALPLLLLGVADDDAKTAALVALERLSLIDLVAKLPEELSGGQAQRVAVARALVAAPALILADEPTGQLDSGTAAAVVEALLETARMTGAALVIATHDPAVARHLDEEWTMADGHLSVDPNRGVLSCSP